MKSGISFNPSIFITVVLVHEILQRFRIGSAVEVEDFLNDFQWLSHTSRYGTLPIKILIKKRSAVRSSFLLSIVLSAGFFFDPKEQLNDLLFTATYLDYCSIRNASDTRKNPSKWNRKENKAGANNKNHNYKYFLERLRGLLLRANISTISLMTV